MTTDDHAEVDSYLSICHLSAVFKLLKKSNSYKSNFELANKPNSSCLFIIRLFQTDNDGAFTCIVGKHFGRA